MSCRAAWGVLLLSALPATIWAEGAPSSQPRLLGQVVLDRGSRFGETLVGGLSGLTYDAASDRYLAISDDASQSSPARFYTLTIDLEDGRLEPGDVEIVGVTLLRDRDGATFAELTLDPEGIALTASGTVWIASEGQVKHGVDPFVRQFRADGVMLRELPLPPGALAGPEAGSGCRHNLAFESVTLSPDGRRLFVASENAWRQDGPAADVGVPSPVRLLQYDPVEARLDAAFLYWVEPIPAAPVPPGGFRVGGLVELLALNSSTLLALERSYAMGRGHEARLYRLSLEGASDVMSVPRLDEEAAGGFRPVGKTLLLDLAQLGVPLDNVEGLTLGPVLAGGERTLVLVSDDNFNSLLQDTQFLAFALPADRDPGLP